MKPIVFIILIFLSSSVYAAEKADAVLVLKSIKILYLFKGNKLLDAFPVVFGGNPVGHKQQEGDQRTPEGRYLLDYKKVNTAFHKSIHVSYPNAQDRENARMKGINPGGAIMIHGYKNGLGWTYFLVRHFNWTNGCIAVSNKAMDTIWDSVDTGTLIEIRP